MQKNPESIDEQLFTSFSVDIAKRVISIDDVSEQMLATHEYIDAKLEQFTHSERLDNTQLACHKGCHHCCYLPVETTMQVIEDISHYLLKQRSPDQLTALLQKLEQDIDTRQPPLMRNPCPLLAADGDCSVYAVRPLACRAFTSTNEKQCESSMLHGSNVQQQPLRFKLYQAATVALQACLKKNAQEHRQLPFIPALLQCLKRKTL